MISTIRNVIIIILTVSLFGKAFAQDNKTIDFFDQIKAYDLSTIITADSILAEDIEEGKEKFKREEVLGFIGDDYQRFYIHFISIIKNPINPYEYFVYGKTKVNKNICDFQGKITIKIAKIYKNGDIPTYTQGYCTCDVILYEDNKQPHTGFINGKLKSEFLIDNKGHFRYDAVAYLADGFSNNQFVGNWTSYKTNISKKCHWGDDRIPESGDLDIGAGEFSVNDKYLKNGWLNYKLANSYGDSNNLTLKNAKLKEDEKWWK